MAYDDTKVPVNTSQNAIRNLLKKQGARRFAFGEDFDDLGTIYALVRFEHEGVSVRLRVPLKLIDETEAERRTRHNHKSVAATMAANEEQEHRRIWRVIHYNLKARMESVEEGVETFVEAFLPHIIAPDGRTIYESLVESGHVELAEPLPVQAALPAGR